MMARPTGIEIRESEATKVLDHGYVKFIESWGSDEIIIESARMSTNKGFEGWDKDSKLLAYLWKNKHHTPFEMGGMTIEVQAPIFVFREWHRHRTQSYNELSARYTELPNLYYIPTIERLMAGKQTKVNKQSSTYGISEQYAHEYQRSIARQYIEARDIYSELLDSGLARELARIVIPVGQYSRMRASANLRNWLQFLTLRMDEHAQWEIRQYANVVGELVKDKFPRTWGLFIE